jgi:acetyl esterase/lipase
MRRPYSLALVVSFTVLVLLLAACSGSSDESADTTLGPTTTEQATTTTTASTTTAATTTTAAPTTTVAPATTVGDKAVAVTERGLVYATWEEDWSLVLAMSAPSEPADAPIVIYLPGRAGDSAPPEMVEGLVDAGALVFVVQYPGADSGPEKILSDHGADARAKAESVACAIYFARAKASDLGNNDPVVVLTGVSNGGGLATHAALFGATLEARWDEYAAEGGPPRQVECEVSDGSTHVDALVGMAGGYDVYVPIYDGVYGRAYQQERDPELQEFLSSSIGVNPDLKVRLFHGTSDWIPVEATAEFATLLTDAGYDVEFVAFDGGHEEPTELAIPTFVDVLGG